MLCAEKNDIRYYTLKMDIVIVCFGRYAISPSCVSDKSMFSAVEVSMLQLCAEKHDIRL